MRFIEITPKGAEPPKRDFAHVWTRTRRELAQAVFLVRVRMAEKKFGRSLGSLWIVLDPIIQACLYFFILAFVFQIQGTDVAFLPLYVSVQLWRLNAQIVGNSPYLLTGNSGVLQQTTFPVRILFMENLGFELFSFALNFIILFVVLQLAGITPGWSWLFLPFILLTHLICSASVALLIAAASTRVRDLAPLVSVFVTLWFYGSPVVYGMERIKEPVRTVMVYVNPFVHIMPAYKAAIFGNAPVRILPLLLILFISTSCLVLVLSNLERLRHRLYQYL